MASVLKAVTMGLAGLGLLAGAATASAAEEAKAAAAPKHHNVVFQVSDDNENMYQYALNNIVNLRKEMGIDNVTVELVAYGPGLKILTPGATGDIPARIKSLASEGVTFSACGNTMKNMEKKTGKKPELTEGVRVVPGGIIRIMELQDAGWNYIRP